MRSLYIALALALSSNAFAYDRAAEVLANCSADPKAGVQNAMASLHCSGYLTGVVDGILMIQSATQVQVICLPGEYASGEQTLKAVTQWLRQNRAHGKESARVAVLKALVASYPCSQR